jgi:hypothetical protein
LYARVRVVRDGGVLGAAQQIFGGPAIGVVRITFSAYWCGFTGYPAKGVVDYRMTLQALRIYHQIYKEVIKILSVIKLR